MHEEEKKFRTALAVFSGGIAAFEEVLAGLASHQGSLGKGVAIMPRELGAIIDKGKAAVASVKTALDGINAILPPEEESAKTEPQPSVAAPQANTPVTSTAAPGEVPASSIPAMEQGQNVEAPKAEEVHAE